MKCIAQLAACSILLLACRQHNMQPASKLDRTNVRPDASLCYQTYGLPDFYSDNALRKVLRQYGIEMKSVAGCVITDSLLKHVNENNDALFAALDQRIGAHSKARIMAAAEGIAKTQMKVEAILRRRGEVKTKEASLAQGNGQASLTFDIAPTEAGQFLARVDVLQYASGNWKRAHWKDFVVDTLRGVAAPH